MKLVTVSIKDPLERVPLTFDFTAAMDAADSLSGCGVVVEAVVAGADGSPNTLLDGAPTTSGKRAVQWIRLGVDGASYRVRATATTTQGRTLVLRTIVPVRSVLA